MESKPTLDALRRASGLRASELLRRANLSTATWNRINHGHPVSHESIVRLLRVLNEELEAEYSPQQIDIHIANPR